jgi:exodeoxyribonuclease V beta subunit
VTWIVWPELVARLSPTSHAVIEASAGTGKTYTLEHLILRELVAGTPLDRLLVVTFTEKATEELRTRVRERVEEVLEREHVPPPPGATVLDASARARLVAARDGFERASISTIHGFCQRVLQEHAFEGGRLFREELRDRMAMAAEALHQTLTVEAARDEAVRPWLERALAAGISLESLERLLTQVVSLPPERLTPTVDLVALERAWRALPVKAAQAELGGRDNETTLPACLQVLASETLGDLLAGHKQVSDAAKLKRKGRGPATVALLDALPDLLQWLVPLETLVVTLLLPPFRRALAAHKARDGLMDYDDMLQNLAAALADPTRGPPLCAELRARYPVGLIDEFQDTDETQWSIFRRIFVDGRRERLTVIGDPKQAIYGFRGADVETYRRAVDELCREGAQRASLDVCYRASAALVSGYSALMARDVLEEGPPPLVRAAPGAPVLEDSLFPAPLVLVALEQTSAPTRREAYAGWIAREIQRLVREVRLGGVGLRASDVFILTSSETEGRQVGQVLREHAVRVAYYKQDGLLQTPEAYALRDVLAAAASPNERSATLRACLTPLFDLPLDVLPDLVPGRAHPALERIALWGELAERRQYARLLSAIFDDSGVLRRAAFAGGNARAVTNYLHLAELILDHVAEEPPALVDVVAWLDRCIVGDEAPRGQEGNVQRLEGEADAVQIMTIHKAKGLEAKVVFLFGGTHRSSSLPPPFPYRRDGQRWQELRPLRLVREAAPGVYEAVSAEERRESARLAYVAMTRAKGRVYVPAPLDAHKATGRLGQIMRRARLWTEAVDRDEASSLAPRGPVPEARGVAGDVALLGTPPGVADEAEALTPSGRPRRSRTPSRAEAPPPPRPEDVMDARAHACVVRVPLEPEAPPLRPLVLRLGGTWVPPAELLHELDASPFRQLLRQHKSIEVTSYSRLKSEAATALDPEQELLLGEAVDVPVVEPLPGELPPGPETGVFLHQLLERVPLGSLDVPLEQWRARDDVRALVDAALVEHRVPADFRADAERLVYAGLTAPLPLEPELRGLSQATRVVREMEFLFPWSPDFVKGYLDVVVEHAGLTWVVDWKSDRLPSYDAAALGQQVGERYRLQVQLYALALSRILDVQDEASHQARFGGVAYVFLRGLGGKHSALWVERPSWATLLKWAEELPLEVRLNADKRGQLGLFGPMDTPPPGKRGRRRGGR